MYGWTQECKRQQELNCEQQDLEKRLAELYGTVEGGADACADLTAPRGETLTLTAQLPVKTLTHASFTFVMQQELSFSRAKYARLGSSSEAASRKST